MNSAALQPRQFAVVLLLTLSSLSHAVNLSNDSTGQVLIYPYYTVQSGNQTLLSVLNLSPMAKAVKLRFFESRNSREVLSFNLYLAPEDLWTASIFDTDAVGPAALISGDSSCTVPQLSASGVRINGLPVVNFSNAAYDAPNADGGPGTLERTREGHIEILEMASILPGTELDQLIGHVQGVPRGCDQLAQEWFNFPGGAGPYFSSIAPASGGLIGAAAIVDSANGTYINFAPEILDGFYRISEHTRPDSAFPSLRSAEPMSIVLHEGNAIRSTWSKPEDAVSSLFVAEQLRNEFSSETALSASSEWVLSFPTKRFYTDPASSGFDVIPAPPFNRAVSNGRACEIAEHHLMDREGGRFRAQVVFPFPGQISPPLSYCFGVNILTIQQQYSIPSRVVGSGLNINAVAPFKVPSGWLNVDFSQITNGSNSRLRTMRPSLEGNVFVGLPVIGFSAVRIENQNAAPGIRAFYGGAVNHKRKSRCHRMAADGTMSGKCSD